MLRERITYEINENGYAINLDGKLWITQDTTNLPYPNLTLEECCLKQIEDLCKPQEEEVSLQDQITDIELAISELYEAQQGGTN